MADILITDLTREQLRWVDQIVEVIGEPVDREGSAAMIMAIQAALMWYQVKQKELRNER